MENSYNLHFWEEAEDDYLTAFLWYCSIKADLGTSFENEIDYSVDRIRTTPEQFPIVYKNVHRALIKRFPYAIFFIQQGTAIIVVAILHTSQDPNNLKRRLGED